MNQDIGKIKRALNIAQVQPPALPKLFAPEKTSEPPLQVAKPPVGKLPPAPVKPPEPFSLQAFAGMGPKMFTDSLPELRKVVLQSGPQAVPDQSTINAIIAKLRNTPESSPEYWPTVLQFIMFASSRNSSVTPPHGSPVSIRVADSEGVSLGTVTNQVVLLDGSGIVNTTFDHSRIILTGKPSHALNVIFKDCVFEVPITSEPTPTVKQAARELSASNLTLIRSL